MPKKEQEATTIDDNQERLEEQRFQEQCFLMDFSEEFMKKNQNVNYTNFTQINTKDSVATLLNKMLGKGVDRLMNVKPAELSLLQPRFRLFKVHYVGKEEKEVELRFDNSNKEGRFDDIRVDDLSRNRLQLGGGAGLKSFEWEDLGTNPGDSGKAFKAAIEMHFQNAADFFYNRARANEPRTSFADLVRTPPKRFTRRGTTNEKHFRIKVQVGWQIPPANATLIDKKLREALENTTITMFLSLTTHRLQYLQNGVLNVTAEYIGAIENKLLSPETDVLYSNADIERQIQNSIANQRASEKRLEELRAKGVEKASFFTKLKEATGAFITNDEIRSSDQLELEGLEEDVEQREVNRETLVKENRAKSYKRLLTSLEESGRLFYIDIPKEEIELLGQARNDRKQFTREVAANRRAERNKNARERTLPGRGIQQTNYNNVGVHTPHGRQSFKDGVDQAARASDEEARNRLADNVSSNNTRANRAKPGGDKRINFFYLGDIVEAALDVVYGLEGGKSIIDRPENADMRFLLGPIEIIDSQGNKRIRSLADVPISLNLFQAWFLKNVVRPARDKYLLRDFLRDLCSELVLKALRPDCLGPSAKGVRNRVSFSIFSLPAKTDQEPIPRGGRHNVEDISNLVAKRKGSTKTMKHYLMMYVSGHKPDKLKGDFKQDVKNGIYHFNVGADRGLLKNVDFDRADVQYLPEARISDDEDVQKGDAFLSEPYNANMFMWGNSIFKPGMMLYINPASLGMGPSIPKEERLPIGGYYTCIRALNKIGVGSFDTELSLNWESFGDESKRVATSEGRTTDPTPSIDSRDGGRR